MGNRVLSVLIVGILILFAGCSQSISKPEGKLLVYASFSTMADFTKKIGGDRVTVTSLMPPGAEPHDWEPTPKDMRGLDEADIFVYSGAGIEGWVDGVVASLDNPQLITVKTSTNITLIHDEDDHRADDPDHHDDHSHGDADPHTWLSPLNVIIEMQEIEKALAAADPSGKEYYKENLRREQENCLQLDEEFSQRIGRLENRDIIVAHSAYGYLCQRYGLNQIGVRGFSPDSEPSPKKMAEVIDYIRSNNVATIYFEKGSSSAVAQALALDTGARILTLDPVENLYVNGEQKDYYYIMYQNLEALEEGLKGGSGGEHT